MTYALRQELAQRIREKKVLVVAGTGVSLAATNGNAVASWRGLIEHGVGRCVELALDGADSEWAELQQKQLRRPHLSDLLGVAEQVERRLQSRGKGDWRGWLRETVGSLEPASPAILAAIRALGVPLATLNYDRLLGIPGPQREARTWLDADDWSRVLEGSDDAILHLHGAWDRPDSVVLGIRSYERVLAAGLAQHMQRVVAVTHSLLFVGCGATFEDPNFKALLDWMATTLKDVERRHYLLATDAEKARIEPTLPPTARIWVLSYGATHDQLVPFLESLAPTPARPAPSSPVPVATSIPARGRFFGRQKELEELTAAILDDDPRPIVILGPGGIGKSKLTIAALHHPVVAARFGEHRFFVRLEEAKDADGIWLALARSLGCEPGGNPRAAACRALAAGRTLLVLDNTETPWEADPEPLATEQALATLAELPGTTLVASLRGSETPGTADFREPLVVQPLPAQPSRDLFVAIAGERYRSDPDLGTLLAALDGLPLAIDLLARRAQSEPHAARLLALWREQRTAVARHGKGGRKDVDLATSHCLAEIATRH
jgi:hypothetical protein